MAYTFLNPIERELLRKRPSAPVGHVSTWVPHNAVIHHPRANKFWTGREWSANFSEARSYRKETAKTIVRLAQRAVKGEADGSRIPVSPTWSAMQTQLAHANVITDYGTQDEATILVFG